MNRIFLFVSLLAAGLAGCTNSPPSVKNLAPAAPNSAPPPSPAFAAPVPTAPAYATESLLANSVYWISNRVQGKDGRNTNSYRATFSSMKWSFESNWPIIRNTNCWLQGVKGLTAMSPFNRQAAYHGPGTAVSPRHILMVTHMRSQPGTIFDFATKDSLIVSRKLIAYSDSTKIIDLSIGLLDADLPPSIEFMRVMPPMWRQIMPEAFLTHRPIPIPVTRTRTDVHPIVGFNHWKQGFVTDFAGYGVVVDKSLWFPDWFGYAAGGDSGHPLCVLANDELFLITLYTTPSGGSYYPDFITLINAEMEALSRAHQAPVYSLTVAEELMNFKTRPTESSGTPAK